MTRIFTTLAIFNSLCLLAAFVAGCFSKFFEGVFLSHDFIYLIHFCLGLLGAIVTLLVHCLIFTYFLGTGRWVKEVAIAYSLPDEPLPRLTRELKRKTFPPALFAMLITIGTSAAGAGAQLKEWPWQVHGFLALTTLAINYWAFVVEFRNLHANAAVIENVLVEVDRIRSVHGLTPNAEALRQEGV